METAASALRSYLSEPIEVGPPDVSGPLAIFPLFGPPGHFEYLSFAQGCVHGVSIKELPGGASVNDLVVHNPTELPVLLFDGEEVLGAQQNRTFDVSVLVPAHATLGVPVSCVEAGRWDGARHAEAFEPARQTAYPALRRLKNQAVHARVAEGEEARADQGAVWDEVSQKLHELDASSATGAMHDGYERRRRELDELTRACSVKPDQTGMLVAIGGRFSVLDRVSQAQVLGSLFDPLVQGYALDAVGVQGCEAPTVGEAREFVESVLTAATFERDGIGLGSDVRVTGAAITGAGVVCAKELVQLSVFADPGDGSTSTGRIRRPSRRRDT